MSFYFKSKKLDISAGEDLNVLMHADDAKKFGLNQEARIYLNWGEVEIYVQLDLTNSMVEQGELGLFNEVWQGYGIPNDEMVCIKLPDPPQSLEYIKKKMLGGKLNYEEVYSIMDDVARRRLGIIEMTYFDATSYTPGFDEDEVYYMTKAMAETGEIIDFSGGDPNKKVIDKHSIGGIPSKGITPILVPILCCFEDVAVPNTSSRAITTPAGTSDMLEVIMPVALPTEQILDVVAKERGCLVWGGGLHLAPADDILIDVKRLLNMESYETFLVSIIAKKVAMKVTHLLVDIPYGPEAKVHNISEAEKVKKMFIELADHFGIKIDAFIRESLSPDGHGIGPVLEIRDVLRIFERHELRPKLIEDEAVDMAGRLLELAGIVEKGKGFEAAKEKLESGEAAEKFWSIAKTQGAERVIKSEELIPAEFTYTVKAEKTGTIDQIRNRSVVNIARALGNPFIKSAGLYFPKLVGDTIYAGDELVTLYATSQQRLDVGIEVFKKAGEFIHIS